MKTEISKSGWSKVNLSPFRGHHPSVFLGRHEDGHLAALVVSDLQSHLEQAGVWSLQTGELIWSPDDAILIAWSCRGRQVLVLRRTYQRSPDHPERLVSALQSEFNHVLERRSWPDRALLGSCVIQFPTGWAHELAASPRGDLATVTWLEQDCAGFVLVRLEAEAGDFQIEGLGEFRDGYYVKPNLIRGPVFSPDGRYAVASCTLWSWWRPGGTPETPSLGGRMKVGHMVILDSKTMEFIEREIFADVPHGWVPRDFYQELLGQPEFTDVFSVQVEIPTGDFAKFSLAEPD